MTRPVFLLGLLTSPVVAAPLGLEPEDLHPGLVAEYRSVVDPKSTVTRVEPKAAFALGKSSPHPRIPAGPFEVTWTGILSIRDPGPIAFSAFVGGELTVTVDGLTVLDGRGETATSKLTAKAPLNREPGYYALTIRYRSLADVPARLQLWWEAPEFAAEPVPAWRLGHVATAMTPAAKQDELAEIGKQATGRFGCARCHAGALPAVNDPPPGPSLTDVGSRLGGSWLLQWLADPAKVRPDAHMPRLFAADRDGFVERWLIAEKLTGGMAKPDRAAVAGDHRQGRQTFLGLGCAACHFVPDVDRVEQKDLNRLPFVGLADRFHAADLVAFLGNPHGRYPDGRMPKLPITPQQAKDIAAYLLLWSKPSAPSAVEPPTMDEIQTAVRRIGARDAASAATTLLNDRGCVACHTGLGDAKPHDVPIQNRAEGCLGEKVGPRFALPGNTRKALAAYLAVANREKHPSPFAERQRKLARAGCVQCHQRDGDRAPPIEESASKLGGAFLQELPFQRTPRMTHPHQRLTRTHILATVKDGSPGLRGSRYSYRMPSFGGEAELLVQALAEADGEIPADDPPVRAPADPTLGTLHGSRLAGFGGYGCVSCHVWDGKQLAATDPGVTGPDLTRTAGRVRRDWFDRFLEAPHRYFPGTPMPAVFPYRQPATLTAVLDGDAAKQKEALWAYFALGKDAPSPKPPPPVPVQAAPNGWIVAQIPIRLPDGKVVESICVRSPDHDLLVYDLATGSPQTVFAGGRILRNVQGRIRQFLADGKEHGLYSSSEVRLIRGENSVLPTERILVGYEAVPSGVRVRWKLSFALETVLLQDTLLLSGRRLIRQVEVEEVPAGARLEVRGKTGVTPKVSPLRGDASLSRADEMLTLALLPDKERKAAATLSFDLPPAVTAAKWELPPISLADPVGGSLERPGYKAIAYPRPKTVSGEDRVMPGAVAVRPKDGQVFVASLKTGELFALRDPKGDGKSARFENYGNGLYQDALSMLAEDDALYVLHRRNLTKVTEEKDTARRFERVAALPHGVADTYDMAYGLAKDKAGRFVLGYAPYSNQTMPGSGGALRLTPGKPPEELAYGMRNPLGWCAGPDGEIFFTDNQGDWVAANKLCHIDEGHYYGWPNRSQPQHTKKPAGKATIWVPYAWARSINGVAYDHTGGKFGPFAGQIFMAELMFGGAIVRANVEKVNGVYQGACFPFWGKGLLGPVTLAFDPRGPLYVGGITEPGWMAQPDRGALFRIDYTGQVPFEMKSLHVRPQGFRIVFTTPVDKARAADPKAYRLEHYRYEYTGSYGSPELDRTAVKVEKAIVSDDGKTVDLTTAPLVKDRVYLITLADVKSAQGESPVYPSGAYTLNEVPKE